ncbi:MAG: TrmH family RNA methyltransferase [Cyclobacteriaceae bacterium]|nr:TrmH family RNA methyltransferase [Cyclobacteriaceae bacterium]
MGAAARALKTMGFSELRLVNPTNHLSDKARWLAHGSTDILDNAKVFTSLEDALIDVDFSIGTTAKERSAKQDYYPPEEAKEIVQSKEVRFETQQSFLDAKEVALPTVNCAFAILPQRLP